MTTKKNAVRKKVHSTVKKNSLNKGKPYLVLPISTLMKGPDYDASTLMLHTLMSVAREWVANTEPEDCDHDSTYSHIVQAVKWFDTKWPKRKTTTVDGYSMKYMDAESRKSEAVRWKRSEQVLLELLIMCRPRMED